MSLKVCTSLIAGSVVMLICFGMALWGDVHLSLGKNGMLAVSGISLLCGGAGFLGSYLRLTFDEKRKKKKTP